jgi:hypothetical protein
MFVYRFALHDLDNNLLMSTEVDDLDPSIDLEFWGRFLGGDCCMRYLGAFREDK